MAGSRRSRVGAKIMQPLFETETPPARLVTIFIVTGCTGYELSWFYNPFAPGYWRAIAIEHGYLRCEVRFASSCHPHKTVLPLLHFEH